jgi:hypothetical protein
MRPGRFVAPGPFYVIHGSSALVNGVTTGLSRSGTTAILEPFAMMVGGSILKPGL